MRDGRTAVTHISTFLLHTDTLWYLLVGMQAHTDSLMCVHCKHDKAGHHVLHTHKCTYSTYIRKHYTPLILFHTQIQLNVQHAVYIHTHTHLSKDWYSFSSIHSHFSVSSAPTSCNTSHRLSCFPSSSTELALAHSCTTADEHEDAVRTKTGRERSRDLTSSSTACAPPHLRLQEHSTENFLKNLAYVHTQQYKVTIIQTCPLSYVHAYTTNVVQHYTISTAHAVALHEMERVYCYTKSICSGQNNSLSLVNFRTFS